jgi:hypothetical protein
LQDVGRKLVALAIENSREAFHRLIGVDIPEHVEADQGYQNAKQNNGKQNARIERDEALLLVILGAPVRHDVLP